MLLRYSLEEEEAATIIEDAVEAALADGWRTPDLYTDGCKLANTQAMTDAILRHIPG